MSSLIEDRIIPFSEQINNCCKEIDNYAPGILTTISALRIAELKKIDAYLLWVISEKKVFHNNAYAWTTFGELLLHGPKAAVGTPPVTPVATVAPPAPASTDVFKFFSDFAASCKADVAYTASIGKDLDITNVAPPFDPTVGKPVLSIKLDANHPVLKYHRYQWQGVAVYLDMHDGAGFKKIDSTSLAHYTDNTTPLPTVNVTQTRSYRVIYLWQGKETGTISAPETVTIVGI